MKYLRKNGFNNAVGCLITHHGDLEVLLQLCLFRLAIKEIGSREAGLSKWCC